MSNSQKGYIPILIILGIVLVIAIAGGVYYYFQKSPKYFMGAIPTPPEVINQMRISTPTPSPWKTYKNDKYGFELTYPREGVVLTDKGNIEGECGKAIIENNGKIDVDNFFQVKMIDWTGTIQDYLDSQRAGKIYNTEAITGTGADEGLYLVGLKKDFEVAVGYPPLLYVKYLFKKGNNLYIVSTFLHPENLGGCINPEVLDPVKYKKYIDQNWNQKNSFKFLDQKQTTAESEFCGGITGKLCATGYGCRLDGNYPDAGGKCIKE